MAFRALVILMLVTTLLSGCAGSGRYSMRNDTAPLRKPTTLEMVDQTPTYLPFYSPSLKPYKVLGKRYYPLDTAQDYSETGIASWYGRKFHGHYTANGEVYDMYAMTAAHKTLPIPSFVRVTNLDNNKSIIVKVNDRGPFHDDRVIDLSYSAAYALDMLKTGTANVKLDAIVVAKGETWQSEPLQPAPVEPPPEAVATAADKPTVVPVAPGKQLFVQVLAASDGNRIVEIAKQLNALFDFPRHIPWENGIYKLRFGPLVDEKQARDLIAGLKNEGFPNAYMLYTAPTLKHN